MKGSPARSAGGCGNASLLNATVDEIDMDLSCIAVWRVNSARPIERG
jgi:hypothetical protein